VVASLDGEFVCKRLKLRPRLCLLPENSKYEPIYIQHGQDLDIMGTVTAAINKFE
jgi:DNA polymerase V